MEEPSLCTYAHDNSLILFYLSTMTDADAVTKVSLLTLKSPLRLDGQRGTSSFETPLILSDYILNLMENPNSADGKHVVVQNGQRVTGPVNQQEAQTEANRRNKLAESSGQPLPENKQAQVKVNLFG